MSVLYFDELWVIDHSTTSQEAATSSGGRSGRGGDILYRWGNPAAYGRGTSNDRKFFGQHDPQWIPEGYEEAGRMLVFNNGNQRFGSQYSSIETYDLPLLPDGTYRLEQNKPYEPADYSWIYKQTDGPLFFSPIISGAERLANGNTFICEGTKGRLFEVDRDGVVRWEYVNPIMRDSVVPQGTVPTNNLVFKAYRYGKDYPAFAGKELRSRGLLERNPTLYPCVWGTVSSVHTDGENASEVPNLYPNPFYDILTVSHPDLSGTVMLVDALGRVVLRATAQNNRVDFHTSLIPNGLYHITTERGSIGTAVKAF